MAPPARRTVRADRRRGRLAGTNAHAAAPASRRHRRPLHRAYRAHRRQGRDADHARGDLRPGCSRSPSSTPRRRRSSSPTTRSSASAHRSGRGTARRASGWPAGSNRGGLDQRPLLLPRRAARRAGVASRTRASAARTRSSASTSASNVKHVTGSPGSPATSGGIRTTRPSARRSAGSTRLLYGSKPGERLKALRESIVPLAKVGGRRRSARAASPQPAAENALITRVGRPLRAPRPSP